MAHPLCQTFPQDLIVSPWKGSASKRAEKCQPGRTLPRARRLHCVTSVTLPHHSALLTRAGSHRASATCTFHVLWQACTEGNIWCFWARAQLLSAYKITRYLSVCMQGAGKVKEQLFWTTSSFTLHLTRNLGILNGFLKTSASTGEWWFQAKYP